MPKFSIIIPVYNVENYIDDCLKSILSQDFSDFEIILINDGSTDNSGQICNFYSNKYNFIKTIHKANGGLSEARNVGIHSSKGEYLLFVDSDDMIFENSLKKINETIEEDKDAEVIFLEAVKLYPNGITVGLEEGYQKSKIRKKSKEEVLKFLSNLEKFPGSACNKLVKRELITKNNIYFEKGMFSEDIDWTIRLLSTAEKYNYCEHKYYYYRQNRLGSITNSIEFKNVLSLLNIIKKWSVNPNEKTIHGIQNEINAFMAYEYIILLPYYARLSKESKRRVNREVKRYSWLLSLNKSRKVRLAKMLKTFFGVEITAHILNLYLKFR